MILHQKKIEKGSMLLEIMLGISMFIIVLPIMFNALQDRNEKLENSAIAKEIKEIIKAGKNYVIVKRDLDNGDETDDTGEIPGGGIPAIPGGGGAPISVQTTKMLNNDITDPAPATVPTGLLPTLKHYGLPSGFGVMMAKYFEVTDYGLVVTKRLGLDKYGKTILQGLDGYYYVVIGEDGATTSTPAEALTNNLKLDKRLKRVTNHIGFQAGLIAPGMTNPVSPAGAFFTEPDTTSVVKTDSQYVLIVKLEEEVIIKEFLHINKVNNDPDQLANTMALALEMNSQDIINVNLFQIINAGELIMQGGATSLINAKKISADSFSVLNTACSTSTTTECGTIEAVIPSAPALPIDINLSGGDLTISVEDEVIFENIIGTEITATNSEINFRHFKMSGEITVKDVKADNVLATNLLLQNNPTFNSITNENSSDGALVTNDFSGTSSNHDLIVKLDDTSGSALSKLTLNNHLEIHPRVASGDYGIMIAETTYDHSSDIKAYFMEGSETVEDIRILDYTDTVFCPASEQVNGECLISKVILRILDELEDSSTGIKTEYTKFISNFGN